MMMMIHKILKMRPRIFRDWGVHTLSCLSTSAICFSRGEADVSHCDIEYYACCLLFHWALCRWLHSCVVDSFIVLLIVWLHCQLVCCVVDVSVSVSSFRFFYLDFSKFNCLIVWLCWSSVLLIASVKHLHINFQVVYLDFSKAAMEVARARAQVSIFNH